MERVVDPEMPKGVEHNHGDDLQVIESATVVGPEMPKGVGHTQDAPARHQEFGYPSRPARRQGHRDSSPAGRRKVKGKNNL